MSDCLLEAAKEFNNLLSFDYIFTLGNRERNKRISIINNDKKDFMHVIGLDHLTDIDILAYDKRKEIIFKKILSKEITYENIKNSKFLYDFLPGTFNSSTNNPCTIDERIRDNASLEEILDNSYNAIFYKWKIKDSKIKTNNNIRETRINADYVLKICPRDNILQNNNYFFIFLYQCNKDKREEDIKLKIMSAFSDSYDLTAGQYNPYTILKLEKRNYLKKQSKILYIRDGYTEEK